MSFVSPRILTDKSVFIEKNEPIIIGHPECSGLAEAYRGILYPGSLAVILSAGAGCRRFKDKLVSG